MRVVVNDGTLAAFINTNETMQKALGLAAENLMNQAKNNAPIGKPKGRAHGPSGYYMRRFQVRKYRNGYRVVNVDPFAHLVEWGSVNNPAYAPIRRAVRTSGLRYVPNPESRGA